MSTANRQILVLRSNRRRDSRLFFFSFHFESLASPIAAEGPTLGQTFPTITVSVAYITLTLKPVVHAQKSKIAQKEVWLSKEKVFLVPFFCPDTMCRLPEQQVRRVSQTFSLPRGRNHKYSGIYETSEAASALFPS